MGSEAKGIIYFAELFNDDEQSGIIYLSAFVDVLVVPTLITCASFNDCL